MRWCFCVFFFCSSCADVVTFSRIDDDTVISEDDEVKQVSEVEETSAVTGTVLVAAAEEDVTLQDGDHAVVVAHTVPDTLRTGEWRDVAVTFANRGSTTWQGAEEGYFLRVTDGETTLDQQEHDDSRWFFSGAVRPGQRVTFALTLRAPFEAEPVPLRLRMANEAGAFGEEAAVDVDVFSSVCSAPLPPSLSRINVVVHNDQGARKILDATPLVHDGDYCTAIGYADRLECPLRLEGHEETDECNAYGCGTAPDTGRAGPSWTFNGESCGNDVVQQGCKHHPRNQFQLIVFGAGVARACTQSASLDDVCGEVEVN